jgi:hypothetical protein
MRNFHNIESRKFPGAAHYVAYGAGEIWHVKKIGATWVARLVSLNRKPLPMTMTGATLADISAALDKVA